MKKCHHDYDSQPVRDWSEVDSGGINRFLQVSTFKSITTTNIFSRVHATLQPALSVGLSVCRLVRHTLLFLSILFL